MSGEEAGEEEERLRAAVLRLAGQWPTYGYRRITALLRRERWAVNGKRVRRLMRLMGLEAIHPRPRLSAGDHSHKVYPYLLRGVSVERADQVWSTDITQRPG